MLTRDFSNLNELSKKTAKVGILGALMTVSTVIVTCLTAISGNVNLKPEAKENYFKAEFAFTLCACLFAIWSSFRNSCKLGKERAAYHRWYKNEFVKDTSNDSADTQARKDGYLSALEDTATTYLFPAARQPSPNSSPSGSSNPSCCCTSFNCNTKPYHFILPMLIGLISAALVSIGITGLARFEHKKGLNGQLTPILLTIGDAIITFLAGLHSGMTDSETASINNQYEGLNLRIGLWSLQNNQLSVQVQRHGQEVIGLYRQVQGQAQQVEGYTKEVRGIQAVVNTARGAAVEAQEEAKEARDAAVEAQEEAKEARDAAVRAREEAKEARDAAQAQPSSTP